MRISGGIPCCMLADLTDTDILSFKLQHHPGMTQNHLCHLRCRRLLQMLSRFKIMQDLPENPRISLCPPCNHEAITSGLFFHGNHILRRKQISVSDDRNLYGFFYLTDNVPVCLTGIELLPGPSMHSNCCRTGGFCNLCHLHRIDMLVIKPFADFYRNRFFDRFYRLFNNLSCEFWIFHECRAFPVVHNLWHRAAHIQVKNIKWAILNLMCNLSNNIRI